MPSLRRAEQDSLEHHYDSPVKYDADFLQKKLVRLENDFIDVSEELNRARVRLRRAEDFEIKYEILQKQKEKVESDLSRRDSEMAELKVTQDELRLELHHQSSTAQKWITHKAQLENEITRLKVALEQKEEVYIKSLRDQKNQIETSTRDQVETAKRLFADRQSTLQLQVRQLTAQLNEKSSVEDLTIDKANKVRKEKDEEIQRLQKIIEKKKQEYIDLLNLKNDEIESLRQKYATKLQQELEAFSSNMHTQNQIIGDEIQGLKAIIKAKNDEISQMIERTRETAEQYSRERTELQREIQLLREKLYEQQAEHEFELVNLKERLTNVYDADRVTMNDAHEQTIQTLKAEIEQLHIHIQHKQKTAAEEQKESARREQQLNMVINERDIAIADFKNRMKMTGDYNANEIKNLHTSFQKIESEKEGLTIEYQTNVAFLNHQISKLSQSCEIKNNEIQVLHEEISKLKSDYASSLHQFEQKWKDQRREKEADRDKERATRQKLQESHLLAQQQWKDKERQLERLKDKLEREKQKQHILVTQLEAQIKRLNALLKSLDQSYKNELRRNQVSNIDSGGQRRTLAGEMERQKSELEAMKLMEIESVRKHTDIQISKLSEENQRLRHETVDKTEIIEKLEDQLRKLEHQHRNVQKMNKQKMIDYQKKVAALNTEIGLTQNLYQAFIEAKSKAIGKI